MTGLETFLAIGSIVIIDIILGGDNAILIALASKELSTSQRKIAMYWGIAGAIGVRAVLTALALYLLKIPLLMFVGGILLVWIAVKLLVEDKKIECHSGNSLKDTVKIIIIADAVMGIDNVVAVAGAAQGSFLLVVLGLLISVPTIMWGSTIILKWIDRFPAIVYVGAAVLAWTAGKMIVSDHILAGIMADYIPYFQWSIPILTITSVIAAGYYKNKLCLRHQNKGTPDDLV